MLGFGGFFCCIYQRAFGALQVQRRHIQVYKSMRLNRVQKENFAALWHGWKRRRHALDERFKGRDALRVETPSPDPQNPSAVDLPAVLNLLEHSSSRSSMHASVVAHVMASERIEGGSHWGVLGESGVDIAAAQAALAALRDVHSMDDRMLRDYSSLVMKTTWGLSEVRCL